jgi:hypothetical protein
MTKIELGKSVELRESQARLIDLISKGEWDQIDPSVLRSLVPDTDAFMNFLKENDLLDAHETRVVLKQMGIVPAERSSPPWSVVPVKPGVQVRRTLKNLYGKDWSNKVKIVYEGRTKTDTPEEVHAKVGAKESNKTKGKLKKAKRKKSRPRNGNLTNRT